MFYSGVLKATVICFAAVATTILNAEFLRTGQELRPGQTLWSDSNQYRLVFQTDGNLVMYLQGTNSWVWHANAQNRGGVRCVLQADGNLVIYSHANQAVWSSGTPNPQVNPYMHDNRFPGNKFRQEPYYPYPHLCDEGDGPYILNVQDDGNLVLYKLFNQAYPGSPTGYYHWCRSYWSSL